MTIIDAHVYCFPPRLRNIRVKLPAAERVPKQAIYRHPEGEYALSLSSPEAIRESMGKSGIDESLLVAFPWLSPELCEENNRYLLESASAGRCFRAVCSVQPRSRGWKKNANAYVKAGAVGLKINPAWQGFALDGKEADAVAEFAADHGVFVMTHVDHAYNASPASPAALLKFARKNPTTKILAAHLGGLLGLYALHEPVAKELGNLWFDTAVSATLPMVRWYTEAGLGERLIFGSDFPFNHCHTQKDVVEGIKRLGLTRAQYAAIFSKNLACLLR